MVGRHPLSNGAKLPAGRTVKQVDRVLRDLVMLRIFHIPTSMLSWAIMNFGTTMRDTVSCSSSFCWKEEEFCLPFSVNNNMMTQQATTWTIAPIPIRFPKG